MDSGDEAGVLAASNPINTSITDETGNVSGGVTPEQSGPGEESPLDDSAEGAAPGTPSAVPGYWEQWAAEQTGEAPSSEPGNTGPDNTGPDNNTEPADSAPEDAAASDAGRGSPVWLTSVVVLVVLLIAGLVTGGLYLSKVSANRSAASDRQAALSAAKTAAADLTTADYKNPQAYVSKLKPLAAGQFLSTFVNGAKGFSTILTEGKVVTSGKVVNAGVESFSGTSAQVDVLAQETVTNSQTKNSAKYFRMEVTMIKSGSKWLVSNVKFVQ